MEILSKQIIICEKYKVQPLPAPSYLKVGISQNVREGILPINGLRISPEADTSGWYIWAGETMSEDPSFFFPLHVEHLKTWCPEILPYLQLPVGWRFLIAPNHEDVWFDESIVKGK